MAGFAKKLVIPILAIVVAVVLAVGAFAAGQLTPKLFALGSESESTDTRVIQSITREEQVVLLSLGIQGISEKTERMTFLGVDVPGSNRASFVQYSFNAKLGIDGRDVRIDPIGEKKYRISIPEYIFIGHSNEDFKLVAENNGALSFITPENDPVEMINNILSEDTQAEYIANNEEILREQAVMFYSGIITGIDPEISITYDFRQ
ncbi:hypothetical protein H5399_01120 [Tessaracoccus sp. MC1627]|uniref:hypothetical protein n=1 Tax=Tessaracoccus sp. MC1627 TaxID=2760312 RepID=UPI0016042006|nr:hypothetical protein [Tessaracoccus sp. MC1627]MBB1511212.1 hypothetical protein [Tessaracoccus sp. MC1627]